MDGAESEQGEGQDRQPDQRLAGRHPPTVEGHDALPEQQAADGEPDQPPPPRDLLL